MNASMIYLDLHTVLQIVYLVSLLLLRLFQAGIPSLLEITQIAVLLQDY